MYKYTLTLLHWTLALRSVTGWLRARITQIIRPDNLLRTKVDLVTTSLTKETTYSHPTIVMLWTKPYQTSTSGCLKIQSGEWSYAFFFVIIIYVFGILQEYQCMYICGKTLFARIIWWKILNFPKALFLNLKYQYYFISSWFDKYVL